MKYFALNAGGFFGMAISGAVVAFDQKLYPFLGEVGSFCILVFFGLSAWCFSIGAWKTGTADTSHGVVRDGPPGQGRPSGEARALSFLVGLLALAVTAIVILKVVQVVGWLPDPLLGDPNAADGSPAAPSRSESGMMMLGFGLCGALFVGALVYFAYGGKPSDSAAGPRPSKRGPRRNNKERKR